MNIQEVKAQISAQAGFTITTLDIHAQKNEAGVVDPNWVSAWYDAQRVRVTMHNDVFQKIIKDKAFAGLAVKAAETVAKDGKEPYTRYVIITPKTILASL